MSHNRGHAPTNAPFTVGDFKRIYDPGTGEPSAWYFNDHTFVRDASGTWHLFGITHPQLDIPEFERFCTAPRTLTPEQNASLIQDLRASASRARQAGVPWFDAHDETQFGHATAPSLTTAPWRKQQPALTVDASEFLLWAPHVICHDDCYYMFYTAGGEPGPGSFRMHLATSTDLWSWTRHVANPLFLDGYEARDPMVLRIDGQWLMYYTATEPAQGGNHVVAYRTSNDLFTWSERHIAFTDAAQGKGAGTTESPFVVQRGDHYYLFLSMRHNYIPGYYADTEVFCSRDPLNWRLEDRVGRLDAHAAEIIRDSDGRYYVSHCGWYQGGVYLAPLHWHDGL